MKYEKPEALRFSYTKNVCPYNHLIIDNYSFERTADTRPYPDPLSSKGMKLEQIMDSKSARYGLILSEFKD